MRKCLRVTVAVLFAYLFQATALPYLKIGGVMLDLVTITLFSAGYALGFYPGLMAGAFCALIMEVSSGNLPGLTAAACVVAGGGGAWIAWRFKGLVIPGKRGLETAIRTLAPFVAVTLVELLKETLYFLYFYLTGMDVGWSQFGRAILAAVEVGVFSLFLLPALHGFFRRKPEDTFIAKRVKRFQEKRKPKKVEPEEMPPVPVEGGSEI